MNFKEYTLGALRTESTLSPLNHEVQARGLSNRTLHSIIGINTEVGEILEATSSIKFKKWDTVNILEEIGDTFWYITIYSDDKHIVKNINNFIEDLCYPEKLSKKELKEEIAYLNTEAQVLLDHSKKVMFYGKSLDESLIELTVKNIIIILGNIAQTISKNDNLDDLFSNIWRVNLAKLKQRFPNKFDETYAEIRNLDAERKILEAN